MQKDFKIADMLINSGADEKIMNNSR